MVNPLLEPVFPTLRPERFRFVEPAPVAVNRPLGHENCGSNRYAIAPQLDRFDILPSEHPDRRIKAQCFGDDEPRGPQPRQICKSGRTIGQELVELGVQAGFGLGVIGQQIPDPGQGIGCRFVTGHE